MGPFHACQDHSSPGRGLSAPPSLSLLSWEQEWQQRCPSQAPSQASPRAPPFERLISKTKCMNNPCY